MPGHDDTLTAGGPWDALEQLCTCGHTRGEHHTLDENCTVPICGCESFQADETPGKQDEYGDAEVDPRAQVQLERMDALADATEQDIGESVRDLTDDLPAGGRIGEIKDELDQILDAALLCLDTSCGHRRDLHHTTEREGDTDCAVHDCVCTGFLEPSDEELHADARDGAAMGTLDQPADEFGDMREVARIKSREPETLEVPSFLRADALRKATRHSNTDEAVDLWSHDAHARAIDKDHAAELEAMTDDQLAESNRVQLETLDNLCTCGHRYGDHAANYGELCLDVECECVKFEALLKPVAETDTLLPDDVRPTDEQVAAFVTGRPLDIEQIRRAARRPELPQVGNLASNPFHITRCATCGHEADQHCGQRACCVEGCDCVALVEYTGGAYVVPEGADIIENAEGHRIPNPGGKLDPKRHTFAHDENIGPAPEDIVDVTGRRPYAVRSTRCAGCGHEKIDHDHTEPHACLGSICECRAFIEDTSAIDHEALERDRRLPYTPPLLRKKYIGEEELRKILVDAGRLDLLQQLPEVDRVTINYGAEHWQEIERLALTPQGSSEAPRPYGEKTITAIATALVELRQCLGASIEQAQMLSVIERNAVAIQKTVDALDLIVKRATGEEP